MSYASFILVMVLSTILMVEVQVSVADSCNVMNIMACVPSMIGIAQPPSRDSPCCSSLHAESETCLCSYLKNPEYGQYLKMPGAARVADACRISFPNPDTCLSFMFINFQDRIINTQD
ncbi:hypothetical protein CTI12_AA039430 [Artemisia annua]|uniref:Bifunctional inhibitor/plant lipid transfer protein/seed storage helical domain-containing protein n=1 Tax=Artemisia annua TaxID=35608 RepID=A0A2U1QEH3_ARTAN|nr:hypothetical protein CTI12_AA039430 [Artemisia annua]